MGIEHTEVVNAIIAGIGSNDNANDQMVQILANLEHAGFAIVPKEPTPAMLRAGCKRVGAVFEHMTEAWRSMLSACQ